MYIELNRNSALDTESVFMEIDEIRKFKSPQNGFTILTLNGSEYLLTSAFNYYLNLKRFSVEQSNLEKSINFSSFLEYFDSAYLTNQVGKTIQSVRYDRISFVRALMQEYVDSNLSTEDYDLTIHPIVLLKNAFKELNGICEDHIIKLFLIYSNTMDREKYYANSKDGDPEVAKTWYRNKIFNDFSSEVITAYVNKHGFESVKNNLGDSYELVLKSPGCYEIINLGILIS